MGKTQWIVTRVFYDVFMPQNGVHLDGNVIKERREAMLLTQDGLARLADIHVNTLARMEGDPEYRASFKTIKAVARQLRTDPTTLVRSAVEGAASA